VKITQALWTERSEQGANRYHTHVQRSITEFAGSFGDIAPVAFACTAWRLSLPAASSPGYVRWHRRVLDVSCVRNGRDGSLTPRLATRVVP
jgi:hypothetical protein